MLVIDVEIYKNYFLLSALQPSTGKVRHFEIYDGHRFDPKQLNAMMKSDTTISFNGNGFDLPLIIMSIYGVNVETIKRTADRIIVEKAPAWRILQDNNIVVPKDWDHIDIIEVPSGRSSLKIYGGRLNAPKLQDLPIEPNALITPEQRELLKEYCINDLETTWLLYQKVKKAVDLRVSMSEQYGVDLRSKSDAQIAETVIKSELEKHYGYEFRGRFVKRKIPFTDTELEAAATANKFVREGCSPSDAHMKACNQYNLCPSRLGYVRSQLKTYRDKSNDTVKTGFRYKDPHVISFETDQLKRVFEQIKEHKFTIKENGSVEMPDWLKKTKINIDGAVYQMGIGGLHSSEKSQFVRAENNMVLADWDVASYYPNIILQQRLAPKSLGNPFLEVYESIVKRRLAAKKAGDKVVADTLKICVNGSFGKLGSKYSALYSPDLLIQTTITGQLALLMLIEQMVKHEIKVISANTDGIVIYHHKDKQPLVDRIAWEWMLKTSYTLEDTYYSAIASRDVNNYLAVKLDGSTKGKGCFADSGLSKNPDQPIIYTAVAERIAKAVPIETTIKGCTDICQFVTLRQVNGGAVWRDELLGKAVRFYSSTEIPEDEAIRYKTNGNRVPKSGGAKPLMQLPEQFPNDVDYQKYIEAANKLLEEVGYSC